LFFNKNKKKDDKMKKSTLNINHVLTIDKASSRTKGQYNDVSKERYYYIYPAPPKPERAGISALLKKLHLIF